MNITKLNQRIDGIEDEIYREKLKVKRCSDEMSDTFDVLLSQYFKRVTINKNGDQNSPPPPTPKKNISS